MKKLILFLIGLCFTSGLSAQEIINNPFIKIKSIDRLSITSIELSEQATIVNIQYNNGNYFGQYIYTALPGSRKAFYIADEFGDRIAELKNVKNISNIKRNLAPNEKVDFSLIFTPIDSTTKTIDIIEGNTNPNNFCFYGVKLEGSSNKVFNLPTQANDEQLTLRGSGTGFLISVDGFVATNYHVVEDAKLLKLVFEAGIDKMIVKAKVAFADKTNDLAVLIIEDTSFQKPNYIPYMLSDDYDVGEEVFTLGYPHPDIMGVEPKLTTGVINALSGIDNDITCMQISLQIQPGNSGGPLFNHYGDVIGITTSSLNSIFMAKYKGNIPQNVNYGVKSDYLKILSKNINLPASSLLKNMELKEKVKIVRKYICLILVY